MLLMIDWFDLIRSSQYEISRLELLCAGMKKRDIVVPPSNLGHDLVKVMLISFNPRRSDSFDQMINEKQYSDVVFLVQARPLHVHRLVLCSRSAYFRVCKYEPGFD